MAYSKDKADGFLNFVIKAKSGDVKLRRGIALDISNPVDRQLLEAAQADEAFAIVLEGTVHVVADDADRAPIVFS